MGRDAKYSKLKVANAVLEDDASLAAFSPATSDDREVTMNLSLMAADLAGIADATNRTLPHRQPPVNRSMLRILQNKVVGMVTANGTVTAIARRGRGAAPFGGHRYGMVLDANE